MLNKVILIGRLAQDPELRYTSSGTPVSNFTLAVQRNFTNRDGEREADFIPIVTWRKLAENCAQHLGKGRMVAVSGRLQIRKRQAENRTFVNPEVVANDVTFLDWPDDSSGRDQQAPRPEQAQKQPAGEDDTSTQEPSPAEDMLDDDDFEVPF